MHRLLGGVAAALVMVLPAASTLAAQDGGGNPLGVEFSGRVQTQLNTTSINEADLGEPIAWSSFETRRIRLAVDLAYGDWMTAKLEPDFTLGNLGLKDAWINWALAPGVEVRFGQFKKPFSRIELTSSTKIGPIERGLRIRGLADAMRSQLGADADAILPEYDGAPILGEEYELLGTLGYIGHDLGVQLHGELGGGFGYAVGLFNGDGGDSRDRGDGKAVAGRLVYKVGDLPLSLGAGVSRREAGADLAGTTFEVDAEWGDFRTAGLHAVVEGVAGDNLAVGEPLRAAQGILGYFSPVAGGRIEGVEPLVRLSYGDPNTRVDGDHGLLFSPGLNLYFFGRNRLMVNWDAFMPGDDRLKTANALRIQGQVYFQAPSGSRDPVVTRP